MKVTVAIYHKPRLLFQERDNQISKMGHAKEPEKATSGVDEAARSSGNVTAESLIPGTE
jgi:hypothetical protein